MKVPTIYELRRLINMVNSGNCQAGIRGKWYPARPLGYFSVRHRLKAAWLVFTGKADAVVWPGGQ